MGNTGTIAIKYNKKFAEICSLLALVVGFAGLLGWLLGNHFLKTFFGWGDHESQHGAIGDLQWCPTFAAD